MIRRAWREELGERVSAERRGLSGTTILYRMAALSSLFQYLCDKNAVTHNPVKGVKRPRAESYEGKTPTIADHQARNLLVKPAENSLKGMRDRAILATHLASRHRWRGITATVLVGAVGILSAEDFSVSCGGIGPIAVHAELTDLSSGGRLVARARNASGNSVGAFTFCIEAAVGCMFVIGNSGEWKPGDELRWDTTIARKLVVPFQVTVLRPFICRAPGLKSPLPFTTSAVQPTEVIPASQVVSAIPPGTAYSPGTPTVSSGFASPESVLDNLTIQKLAKAGLSDDVILRMIQSQPGRYTHSPDDVIALKQAGVSDKVISVILERNAGPSDVRSGRQTRIERNARLYIVPMAANLNAFVSAEIVKQNVPLTMVASESDAEYILTGLSQPTVVAWYDVIAGSMIGGKDRLEATATLIRVKDRSFVWAGESGDRSLIFGAFKRGGERKLAERMVREMKRDLFQ